MTLVSRLVLFVLAALAVVGAWVWSSREPEHDVAAVRSPEAQEAKRAQSALVAPLSEASSGRTVVEADPVPADVRPADSEVGALAGRVLIDDTLASERCVFTLERVADGKDYGRLQTQGRPSVALYFGDLRAGLYRLHVAARSTLVADPTGARAEPRELVNEFHVVQGVRVLAGDVTHDPQLDPLDLRPRCRVVRFTLVDDVGAPWPNYWVTATASAACVNKFRCDERGAVDFVLEPSVANVELALTGSAACIVSAAVTAERSVVVVPRRPSLTLHVELTELPKGTKLGVFVRNVPAEGDGYPSSRDAVFARFDATTGEAVITLRRLGRHELEWRVKRRGATVTVLDPEQTLDIRASSDAQFVTLELPAAVRDALR